MKKKMARRKHGHAKRRTHAVSAIPGGAGNVWILTQHDIFPEHDPDVVLTWKPGQVVEVKGKMFRLIEMNTYRGKSFDGFNPGDFYWSAAWISANSSGMMAQVGGDPSDQLAKGIEVEREHKQTLKHLASELVLIGMERDPNLPGGFRQKKISSSEWNTQYDKAMDNAIRSIVHDHIDEIPDYYDRLAKMEAEAKQQSRQIPWGVGASSNRARWARVSARIGAPADHLGDPRMAMKMDMLEMVQPNLAGIDAEEVWHQKDMLARAGIDADIDQHNTLANYPDVNQQPLLYNDEAPLE
jgi:hypothetical protein